MKTMSVLNFLSYFLYYLPLVVFALLSLFLLPVLLFVGFFAPLTVSLFLSKYIDFFERQHAKVQIEYYTMRRETPAIEFLATSGKVVTSPKTKRALNVTR